jgi:uncharacterized protein (TIGR02284 family)
MNTEKEVPMAENEHAVSELNDLIEILKDGEKGFKTAADGLMNPKLREICLENSKQRGQFARELQSEVRSFNAKPAADGSVAGALHRGWIDIMKAVTGQDEDAIVDEIERGEDAAKEAYEKALKCDLPSNVTGIIDHQYAQVKATHDYFSALKHAHAQ